MALHHLDVPWKPAEVEQREGRILRQGNDNEVVDIFRYVTEGSFDAYMWQALETKARFISQVMAGGSTVRQAEDIGGQELSYAEVKAIASGNPAVLTLAEADAERTRLSILKKSHADEQYLARRKVKRLPEEIAELEAYLQGLNSDAQTLAEHDRNAVVVAGHLVPKEQVISALQAELDQHPKSVLETSRFELGAYRGIPFHLQRSPHFPAELVLAGNVSRRIEISSRAAGARAVLGAAERLATSYPSKSAEVSQELKVAKQQLTDYQARVGRAFAHEDYLEQITTASSNLRAALSGKGKAQDETETIGELADRVQTLLSANQVDENPSETIQRDHPLREEEPVTARVRKRIVARQHDGSTDKDEARDLERKPLATADENNAHPSDITSPAPLCTDSWEQALQLPPLPRDVKTPRAPERTRPQRRKPTRWDSELQLKLF